MGSLSTVILIKKIMKKILTGLTFLMCVQLNAQVTTNYSSTKLIGDSGYFKHQFKKVYTHLPAPDTALIIAQEQADSASGFVKPFRFAKAIKTDINVAKSGDWEYDAEYAYCKLGINVDKAKSLSLHFDKFHLPDNAEMYIYNSNGVMITGPITNKENNPNDKWGSSIYKGDTVIVEVKLPKANMDSLR